jgi:hypothetical protein
VLAVRTRIVGDTGRTTFELVATDLDLDGPGVGVSVTIPIAVTAAGKRQKDEKCTKA